MIKKVAFALYFVLFVVLLGPGLALGLIAGVCYGLFVAGAFVCDFGQTVGYPMAIPLSALVTISWLPFVMSKLED